MGSPKISNGMNEDAQRRLLAEERSQNRADELDRRKWAEEEDAKRIAREADIEAQKKADERAKIAAAQMAEDAAATEAEAQAKERNALSANDPNNPDALSLWAGIYNAPLK